MIYAVAVRELCEFAAKSGDLDTRFTPSPTSEEGVSGHKIVAARRGASHRAEVKVSAVWRDLVVKGRADGFDAAQGVLEEVKTFKGQLAQMAANKRALHWAQAKVYGSLLCQQHALSGLRLRLVYFDVGTQAETVLEERCSALELLSFFEGLCKRFLAWAQGALSHRAQRDEALAQLAFAHATFRPGQRALAENTYRAAQLGRCLLAQAGTGIGKTIATLFALLKAMPHQRLDKVFFLTAKTSGQAAPLDALAALLPLPGPAPLRVLQIVARDKACDRPGSACHGESCDLARGFYDRLPPAREELVSLQDFGRETVQRVAARHGICRYYLAQELVRWADMVIADYNYQFDGSALLHAMTQAAGWRVALLVDEAHNLVERARDMHSARLCQGAVQASLVDAPPSVAKSLRRLQRSWAKVVKVQQQPYAALDRVPETLLSAMADACSAIDEQLTAGSVRADGPLLELHFGMLAFKQLAESLDKHSFFEIERGAGAGASSIGIRNVVPAPFLKRRFQAVHASVLFSATLMPTRYYSDMLGLAGDAAVLCVEPPFAADQLEVRVAGGVSTRYAARGRSLVPIVDLIGAQFERRPGNYLAFFSSFDYLERAVETFAARHPTIPAWRQQRRMAAEQRDEFLQRLQPDGEGVAFAVLGGSFSEGIDLPGTRLVGAFVVTLGLPQVNAVNEQMRVRMEAVFGSGYEYVYLYPGLRKVVQAAGRVIRTPTDRGVVCLIDERYSRADVRELLPAWWNVVAA